MRRLWPLRLYRAHSIPIASPLSHFGLADVCRITGESAPLNCLFFKHINNYGLRHEMMKRALSEFRIQGSLCLDLTETSFFFLFFFSRNIKHI
jgi:hypothetical protein